METAAGTIDTEGLFDRDTGVLNECADAVTRAEVVCYQAPADNPVQCLCPARDPVLPENCTVDDPSYIGAFTHHHIDGAPIACTVDPLPRAGHVVLSAALLALLPRQRA